jgi:hypothetical protein
MIFALGADPAPAMTSLPDHGYGYRFAQSIDASEKRYCASSGMQYCDTYRGEWMSQYRPEFDHAPDGRLQKSN